MANYTTNLNLSVTPESTNKSFKAWRLEMDNDSNSNMTKIDAAFGKLNASATTIPASGLVSFESESSGLPLRSCIVNIEPHRVNSGIPTLEDPIDVFGCNPISVWHFSKNYFPNETVTVTKGTGNVTVAFPVPLPAGTYTISFNLTSSFDGSVIIHLVKSDGSLIQTAATPGAKHSFTFSSPASNEVHSVRFYAGDKWATSIENTATFSDIQVEPGSAATSFEKGTTIFNETLSELVYGGTLDLISGTLTVTYRYYKPTNWYANMKDSDQIRLSANLPTDYYGALHVLSNVATSVAYSTENIQRYGCICWCSYSSINNTPITTFTASASKYSDYEAFKQALLDANAYIVYRLASPIVYKFTPNMISTYAGTNHVWSNAGNVSVKYGAYIASLQGELEALGDKVSDLSAIVETLSALSDG